MPQERSLATPTGFEPAISALTGQYVKPLHHGAAGCSSAFASLEILARRCRGGQHRSVGTAAARVQSVAGPLSIPVRTAVTRYRNATAFLIICR